MAKLKSSEKRLLSVFGVLIVAIGGMTGYRMLGEQKKLAVRESIRLKGDIKTYRNLLARRDLLDQRRRWTERKTPVFTTEENEAPKLQAIVDQAASITGAKIVSPRPLAMEELGNDLVKIGLTLVATGSNDEVIRFLALLQSRDGFRKVETLKLSPDRKEPEIVQAEITLTQIYRISDQPLLDPTANPVSTGAITASAPADTMPAPIPTDSPPRS